MRLMIVFLLVLLAACSSSQQLSNETLPIDIAAQAPGIVPLADVSSEAPATVPSQNTAGPAVPPSVVQSEPSTPLRGILDKHKMVQSYRVIVDNGALNTYDLIQRGKKIKKSIQVQPIFNNNTVLDHFYLDRSNQTAYGICDDLFICPKGRRGNIYMADFALLDSITPLDIISTVTTAKEISTERYDGRASTIIEYNNSDGLKERLWIDQYSGIPLRQVIFEDGEKKNEHTFTALTVNAYKDKDVSLPSAYMFVNQTG